MRCIRFFPSLLSSIEAIGFNYDVTADDSAVGDDSDDEDDCDCRSFVIHDSFAVANTAG